MSTRPPCRRRKRNDFCVLVSGIVAERGSQRAGGNVTDIRPSCELRYHRSMRRFALDAISQGMTMLKLLLLTASTWTAISFLFTWRLAAAFRFSASDPSRRSCPQMPPDRKRSGRLVRLPNPAEMRGA